MKTFDLDMLDTWYARLNELVEDIENLGYEVLESCAEYIVFADDEDNQYIARLGGTPRTIIICSVERL